MNFGELLAVVFVLVMAWALHLAARPDKRPRKPKDRK